MVAWYQVFLYLIWVVEPSPLFCCKSHPTLKPTTKCFIVKSNPPVKHKVFFLKLLFENSVSSKYEEKGVEELDEAKLPVLLNLKYQAIANAEQSLGSVEEIRSIFFDFQHELFSKI